MPCHPQDLLARLERLGKRIMSTPADKRKTSERSLFQALDEKDWRGLQVANALRRLLFPLTLVSRTTGCCSACWGCDADLPRAPQIVDKTTRKPVQQTDLSRQWEAQIRLNEFALLQRSILEQLQAGEVPAGAWAAALKPSRDARLASPCPSVPALQAPKRAARATG